MLVQQNKRRELALGKCSVCNFVGPVVHAVCFWPVGQKIYEQTTVCNFCASLCLPSFKSTQIPHSLGVK